MPRFKPTSKMTEEEVNILALAEAIDDCVIASGLGKTQALTAIGVMLKIQFEDQFTQAVLDIAVCGMGTTVHDADPDASSGPAPTASGSTTVN